MLKLNCNERYLTQLATILISILTTCPKLAVSLVRPFDKY